MGCMRIQAKRCRAPGDAHVSSWFFAGMLSMSGSMPGYPSKKTPPVFPHDPHQPDPSVAQKGERPWSMKWVIAAVVVFAIIFNVYFFVFHDK